jgi:hypothetical protein
MAYFRTLLHQIVPIVLLCVGLISCDAPGEPEIAVEVTLKPTIEAPIVTDEPSPTSIQSPTETPEPSARLTTDGSPTPTPDFRALEGWDVSESASFVSSNGQWFAHTLVAFNNGISPDYYSYFAAKRTDGSVIWVAEDSWSMFGMGFTWPMPYRWSNDGEHLYYTHNNSPDGCSYLTRGGLDLYSINLKTGGIASLLEGGIGYSIALSPDETQLAYYSPSNTELIVRNLESNAKIRIDIPETDEIGEIFWSPDQTNLIANGVFGGPCKNHILGWFSILRIDLISQSVSTLVDLSYEAHEIVEWTEQDRILLKDANEAYLWLDPITGDLTPRE